MSGMLVECRVEASCIGLKNEGGMMKYKEETHNFLKK